MSQQQPAAYRIDGANVPRAQFYATACHPGRSVVVEACAGAGKTWMLVSRIVRALLDGARPHEILAITFTRKAAAEMRERLVDWLRAWSEGNASEAQRIDELCARGMPRAQAKAAQAALAGLNDELLRGGRMVEIRTFHAWFSQLLRAAPLELLAELQLSPNMRLLEEATDHEPAIFRRFHARVLDDPGLSEDYHAQVRLRGRSALQRWLQLALGKRIEIDLAQQAGVLETSVEAPAGEPGVSPYAVVRGPELTPPLQRLVRKLAAYVKQALQQTAAHNLSQALAETDDRLAFEGVYKALMTDKHAPRKRLGDHPEQAEVCAMLLRMREVQQQHEAHAEHLRMVRLSRVLIEEFGAYKREQGLADMADLERCALALLRDSSLSAWMQERLDARVRHVLIDEFQDTSPLQWHALHAWLAGYGGAGGGHSGQRPPSVFIVGDPKQSIYRFRRAEPRVFEAARDFVVEGLGGAVLTCDHTRRNAPEVLDALNEVFGQAQRAGEFSGFRAHTTEVPSDGAQWSLYGLPCGVFSLPRLARAVLAEAPAWAPVPWRDTLTTPRDEPQTLSRQQEAHRVAHAIAALVRGAVPNPRNGRPLTPSDIHVLSRKRTSLRLLAQELQALHLPFAAPEAFRLMDSAEVQDVVALLDALASSQHHLSLARALRSPIFSVSDADLVQLAQGVQTLRELAQREDCAAHEVSWWAALTQAPDDGFSPALRRARRLLAAWHAVIDTLPPHDVLDRIFNEGEVMARMAAAVPAAARAAAQGALQALMAQALMLDGARYATLYNFVRALKQRALKLMPPAQAEAVQLLTVHGAKGLEAEVVFVMDADPEPQSAEHTTVLIDWPVESPAPTTCAFVYSESRCPPSLETLLARERAARQREELNGLYVAMTRARECLVISSTERRQGAPSFGPDSARAQANWWQRLQPVLTAWPLALGDGLPPAPADARIPLWGLPAVATLRLPPAEDVSLLEAQGDEPPAPAAETDSLISRVGQAVHLVLQWATHAPGSDEREGGVAAAARQFGVSAEQVAPIVSRILDSPACAPFFDRAALAWADNEVAVTVQGRVQRIDRLVAQRQTDGATCWWVLDYKLHESPQTLPAYRDQLLAYARAVGQLQPGEPVRCAFITGQGEVVEVDG
jgi:ATP-dependent helicase/nuclease subunit A